MKNRKSDLGFTDERLKEWGRYFRDRRMAGRCRSIEHRFRATHEDYEQEGWGEPGAPVVRLPINLQRVLKTHEAIMSLDIIYRWTLTYAYAFPSLPRFVVLRCMRKFTGRRLNWQSYLEALDIARFRLHTTISRVDLLASA